MIANRDDLRAAVEAVKDSSGFTWNPKTKDWNDPKSGMSFSGAPPEDKSKAPEAADGWPAAIEPEAFHGLAGEFVRTIEPHTESDTAALMIQFLVAFGNAIGRSPYFRATGADFHFTNLYAVLVGQTSRGRKGSSWNQVLSLFRPIDSHWTDERVQSGAASGEGLIAHVRDPIEKQEAKRDKDKTITGYQTHIEDHGVSDKRLLLVEPEFARVLQVAQRDSNILSSVIRQAWDSGHLRNMTKNTPQRATGAHVSIIGHITKDELVKSLATTESSNGFANRYLWICVKRSKLLPRGGALHTVNMQPLINRLCDALNFARTAGEMTRDDECNELWDDVYGKLTADQPGLFGAVTSRSEAQVLRLSCLYALLEKSAVVGQRHLLAALALWKYCEDSARFIFGDSLGDQTADVILQGLRNSPGCGLTRQQISEGLFARNKRAEEITRALNVLQRANLARFQAEETNGRPAKRWFAASSAPSARMMM